MSKQARRAWTIGVAAIIAAASFTIGGRINSQPCAEVRAYASDLYGAGTFEGSSVEFDDIIEEFETIACS